MMDCPVAVRVSMASKGTVASPSAHAIWMPCRFSWRMTPTSTRPSFNSRIVRWCSLPTTAEGSTRFSSQYCTSARWPPVRFGPRLPPSPNSWWHAEQERAKRDFPLIASPLPRDSGVRFSFHLARSSFLSALTGWMLPHAFSHREVRTGSLRLATCRARWDGMDLGDNLPCSIASASLAAHAGRLTNTARAA